MTLETKNGFQGRTVVAFESRMADIMAQAIARKGGKPLTAPSMQEIPLDKNPELFSFAEKLFSGQIDLIIFMTGVGTRMLVDGLSSKYPKEKIIEELKKRTLVVRGPKPVQALRELGITADVSVPEPNTFREILETLDLSRKSISLEGKTVAVQEYGVPSAELLAGLKKRGAHVVEIPIYRWALPDDLKPLQNAIEAILNGEADFTFFTNAVQIRHLLKVAAETGHEKSLRKALSETVVASIGPTCSDALRQNGISVDFEPSHGKMGHLIAEAAEKADELLKEKKNPEPSVVLVPRVETKSDVEKRRRESVFLKACRREAVPYTPVWLMRQAGRYMKSYRRVRDKVSFLELCKNKELCAEVTLDARDRLNTDAAILFSDILLVTEPMGLGLAYEKGDGPVISGGEGGKLKVDALREIRPRETLNYVFDAVKLIRSCLKQEIPLIGFSGAPFTLASYILEGGGSKVFLNTKKFMRSDTGAWNALMEKLTRGLTDYLNAQVEAGADAIQIFDSWAGCLSPDEYREFVLPHSKKLIAGIQKGVPVIHFGTGTGPFLNDFKEAGGDVIGLDFHIRLNEGWKTVGYDKAVQGNLDPALLFSDLKSIRKGVESVLKSAENRSGHIFNLGHGIMPATPEDHVVKLVEMVHELSAR